MYFAILSKETPEYHIFTKGQNMERDDPIQMIASSEKYINSNYEIQQQYKQSITISKENPKFEMWWCNTVIASSWFDKITWLACHYGKSHDFTIYSCLEMSEKPNFQLFKERLLPQDDLKSFRWKYNKVAY